MQPMNRPIELLLVEDNPGDVDFVRSWLKKLSDPVNLSVARDGYAAIAWLHERKCAPPLPDIILLDLNLPKKGGREVLVEVKQNPMLKRIPVIVLTSSKAPGDIDAAYRLGANCYLTKSIDLAESKRVLNTLAEFWFHSVQLPSAISTYQVQPA